MSYSVEIVESSSNFIELEATVGDNPPTIEIIQENSSEIIISDSVALLPAELFDNIRTTIDSTLVGSSGIVIDPLTSGIIKIYSSGLQPSGNYSVVGHSHTIGDITNFSSGVNNLVSGVYAPLNNPIFIGTVGGITKNMVGLGYVDNTSDIDKPVSIAQAIANSGVQNYSIQRSNHVGTQTSSTISNFDSSVSGLIPITNISAGSGISISSNNKNFTVSVTGQFGLTGEQVDDRVNDLLKSGSYINLNYNDSNDSLTINVTGLQPSGNYSIDGHSHTSSNITDFNSAVSGLLPVKNIINGSYTNISNNSGLFTVNVTGLQPSGDYSISGHNHSISDITNLQDTLNYKQPSGSYASLVNGRLPLSQLPIFLSTQALYVDYDLATGGGDPFTIWVDNVLFFDINTMGQVTNGEWTASIIDIPYGGTNASTPSGARYNLGIGNIDNTSDLDKPISSLTQTALNNKASLTHTHGNLSNDGKIGSLSGQIIVTTTSGLLTSTSGLYSNQIIDFSSAVVSAAPPTINASLLTTGTLPDARLSNNVVFTTDSRLSDPRVPLSHNHIVSEITNFGSGVSGLLPVTTLTGNSGIYVSNNGSAYNISSTGLAYLSGSNFTSLSVTGVPVSISGHKHSYSDITNFSSGVQDSLTTTLLAGNFINIVYNSGLDTLTISSSGLQPSGNYSLDGHTHASSGITDFNSSVSGLLPVKDISGSGYVSISSVSGNYTIGVTGLQAAGSYANSVHSHGNISSSGTLGFGNKLIATDENGSLVESSVSIEPNRIYLENIGLKSDDDIDTEGQFNITSVNNSDLFSISHNAISGINIIDSYQYPLKIIAPSSVVQFQTNGSGIYVDNTLVSISGHSHNSNDITNFGSAVSGLLPSFATELDVYVKNTTGGNLYKGQAVYINGAQGDNPTITLAIASSESTSSKTLGLLKQNLALNEFGYVVTEGLLEGIDTNDAIAAGDAIWLSPSISGGLVYGLNNKPYAPNHLVFIGYVLRKQQNNGKVYIKPQNGFELQELHNVAVTGATNGQFLQYNTASGLWVPSSSGNFTNLTINNSGISLVGHSASHMAAGDDAIYDQDLNSTDSPTFAGLNLGSVVIGTDGNQIVASGPSGILELEFGYGIVSCYQLGASRIRVGGTDVFSNSSSVINRLSLPLADSNNRGAVRIGSGVSIDSSGIISVSTDYASSTHNHGNISNSGTIGSTSGLLVTTSANGLLTTSSTISSSYINDFNTSVSGLLTPYALSSKTLSAGSGLVGGGDLSSNRSFDVGAGDGISVSADSIAVDSTVIRTTGTQTISGNKDYTGSLTVNSINVSVSGHNHSSSDISNFSSSVSGLLPITSLSAGSGVDISSIGTAFTISATGSSGLSQSQVDSRINTLVSGIYQPLLTNPVTGAGTSGYVSKWNGSNSLTSGILYDNGSNIGINTTSPSGLLDIAGNLTFNTFTEKIITNTNSGSGVTLNIDNGTIHKITLTNNCTFTMPSATAGKSFSIFLYTGSGNYTASFNSVLWADSAPPTATTIANKVDILNFISDGSYWYGSYSQNYG